MKMIKWPLMIALGISLLATGCFFDLDDDGVSIGCVNGEGPVVTQDLNLPPFTGVHLAIHGEVFITQGDAQTVTIEAKQNIIDEVELDVNSQGVWVIETDRCLRDAHHFKVFITIPTITELAISGSGDMISENFLVVNDIDLRITGSGDMDLGLEADDIQMDITGSGDISVEGTGDDLDLTITGSGDIRTFPLEVNTARVIISGSGDAQVNVQDELDVRISGSGNVEYKGNPTLDVTITGSGDVIDAN